MTQNHDPGRQTPGRTTATTTLPRYTGCPCGCLTELPWLDDPDCVRHLPAPEPREAAEYDVITLGLAPHDRGRCRECRAVGA